MSVTAYIGLGSNMGDRQKNIRLALDMLELTGRVSAVSSLYCTAPVGRVDQAEFLNAVAALETDLTPQQLLSACGAIEGELGRQRGIRWGPRTIDLDILLFGDQQVRDLEPALTIPHPLMAERRFVLVPLVEIAPQAVHPALGRSASQLLADLRNDHRVVKCDR